MWIKRGLIQKQHYLVNTCKYYDKFSTLCKEKRITCTAESCGHYQALTTTKKEIKRSLKKGIHLFEIKSNRDTMSRFGFQLPHYCLLGDYIWLVIENKKIPMWLPPFVGVIRYTNNTLTINREAMKIERTPRLSKRVIQSADPTVVAIRNCNFFLKFLRAWFINSIFQIENNGNNLIEMSHLDSIIRFQKKINKVRNVAYLDITQLNEFIEELIQIEKEGFT